MHHHLLLFGVGLFLLQTVCYADRVDFQRDIAPILEERCWDCHGEDDPESSLRLDRRVGMLVGGDSGLAAIVPGKPDKSYLVEVINHVDEDMAMPPDEEKLPAEQIALLTRWIEEGALWPGQMQDVAKVTTDHWAFQPIVRPREPESSAIESSVDTFLKRKLSTEGLDYSQPAEPRTLIRRVSIILTGLIPTAKEVQDFVVASEADAETAYADLVDRLLQSPHFGERWAQHWLDVIRWAETNGSEANLYRKNAWFYRDYVVRAFNEDKPYDQFIREQIAGDTMGAGEATGFLVAGPHVPAATVGREPSAIRQARADRMDEVMQTVGASIMGVTIGCARCHNHKFDPISIKDYYAMTGVFQDIEFGGRFPELAENDPRKIHSDKLEARIAEKRKSLAEFGGWEESWGAFRELHFPNITTKAIRIRFKTPSVFIDELEVFGPADRDENLAHQNLGTRVTGVPEQGHENRNPIERIIDGHYGTMTWRASFDKASEDRPWAQLDFSEAVSINRLRLSNNREYYYDVDYLDKKHNLANYQYDLDVLQDDGSWKPWVGTWAVKKKLNEKHPKRAAVEKSLQELINELITNGPQAGFVGRFIPPQTTHVLHRGSPESPRDEVVAAAPAVFDGDLGLSSNDAGPKRRALFARWVTDPKNPLTARVMANRMWHHVFGQGIVTTTSDFGTAGASPTHPELLDWLAAEFVEPSQGDTGRRGWKVKPMIRMLLMSEAFRQSSSPRSGALTKDAGSTLLWRFPPKRVEAEVIRDSILRASGRLDLRLGGKSYRIHNEKKTYAQWKVLDNHGPQTWRRMLYQERMRRVDDQMFTAFDFPDCGQVRALRPVSTTPLQALNLMNSDFVIEQSKHIADRASKESDDLTGAVNHCFQWLLGRDPDDKEREACAELGAEDLSLVCRALINSNEFAFLP